MVKGPFTWKYRGKSFRTNVPNLPEVPCRIMVMQDDARANQNAWSSWGCWTFLLVLQFWFLFSGGCLRGNNYEGKDFSVTGYKRWLISDQVVFGHQGIHCNTLCVDLLCYRHHPGVWPVQLQVSSGVLWVVWSSWNSVYYTVCWPVVLQASPWCMTCPFTNLTRCSLNVGELTVLHTLCVVLLCFRHHPGAWPVQSQVSPEPAEVAGGGAEQGHGSQKQWVGWHVILLFTCHLSLNWHGIMIMQ